MTTKRAVKEGTAFDLYVCNHYQKCTKRENCSISSTISLAHKYSISPRAHKYSLFYDVTCSLHGREVRRDDGRMRYIPRTIKLIIWNRLTRALHRKWISNGGTPRKGKIINPDDIKLDGIKWAGEEKDDDDTFYDMSSYHITGAEQRRFG
ncbi:MAG: hypothetical protein ACXADY_27125 [Candidatus Hodarchaeales archaeon]